MESGYDDQFRVGPQDVIGQSQKEGYYYPERSMAAKQAGFNPLIEAAPLFTSRKRGGGQSGVGMSMSGGSQKAPEAPSPFASDAEFYANSVQDFGAAAALMSSKNGESVFQMYDPYEFDDGLDEADKTHQKTKRTIFRIIPKGSRQVPTPEGVKDLPVHAYASRMGVTSVPFKGGDEGARAFRNLTGDTQMLLSSLTQLEQIYAQNAILTPYGYSEASNRARGLETTVIQQLQKVLTGAKGMGGQVSDNDIKLALTMTPQRASSWVTRYKGNETALLKQVRAMAKDKLRSVANANGMDFLIEDEEGGDTAKHELFDNNSTTLE